jgi:hypothetical protein
MMYREQAIDWLLDLDFTDIESYELDVTINGMTDIELAGVIEEHYAGGLWQFIQDSE